MLAHRIVPQLLMRGRQLIKGARFNSWRPVGVVTQAVRIHQLREVDELMLVDIGATPEKRGPDLELIRELVDILFSPLTVGGGVKTIDDIRALLLHGADKVLIGTAAMQDKRFVCEAASRFGSSTLVGAIDYKYVRGTPLAHIKCGTHPLLVRPEQAAEQMEECGIGEILLTCMDREGTLQGYDLATIESVSSAVHIPVVASGGCAGYEDMLSAIQVGAEAVAAGALYQFSDHTPAGAAEYLHSAGVEVRCV